MSVFFSSILTPRRDWGEGGGGDSRVKSTGMLVGTFKLNL